MLEKFCVAQSNGSVRKDYSFYVNGLCQLPRRIERPRPPTREYPSVSDAIFRKLDITTRAPRRAVL